MEPGKPSPMIIERDIEVVVDGDEVIRADVFRPVTPGRYPVIASLGPYAKNLPLQQGFASVFDATLALCPEVGAGSSMEHLAFEVVDPEKWVPHGYAVIRADSRGTGRSSGHVGVWSQQEARDFSDVVEWAGTQPWSTGKVGTCGMSYYATVQWLMAALQPPHLVAICPWDGWADTYRDMARHGGILSDFLSDWYDTQIRTVQHGIGSRGMVNQFTGMRISGEAELTEAELLENIGQDIHSIFQEHELYDDVVSAYSADLPNIKVPVLASAGWGSVGQHLRGATEGFARVGSAEKWLYLRDARTLQNFLGDYGLHLQQRFFDHYLKGDGDWLDQAPVHLQVRQVDGSHEERDEQEWPLARTRWQRMSLDPRGARISPVPLGTEQSLAYRGFGKGITMFTDPLEAAVELPGPASARLGVSSSTVDADLFVVVRVFDEHGEEVFFQGIIDANIPLTNGWLRASHRKLDENLSTPFRPYHSHDEKQPLVPGQPYALDIEILPTSVVLPAGYRLAVSVQGTDFENGKTPTGMSQSRRGARGSQFWEHSDLADRPADIFDGEITLHAGGRYDSSILLPIVSGKEIR